MPTTRWASVLTLLLMGLLSACADGGTAPETGRLDQTLIASGTTPVLQRAPLSDAFIRFQETPPALRAPRKGASRALGYIPDPVDLSHNTSRRAPGVRSVLPESYDLRQTGRLTPVRDQGACGSCWSFATYSAIESYLLPGATLDYSENHLKNTHGFDPGHCEGGNRTMSTAYLTRFSGPVLESEDPYNVDSDTSPFGLTPNRHVQQVLYLPARSDSLDNDTIKQAVMEHGAVMTSMFWEDTAYNAAHAAFYYDGTETNGNHAVAIVGWDDTFPASRFAVEPPGDGAFIIRNSWGTSFGEEGYFYISYYDKFLNYNTVFSSAEVISNYSTVYSYDPLGWTNNVGYSTETAWAANIFTAVADENLQAVGTFFSSYGSSYIVQIYDNPPEGNPTGGTLLGSIIGIVEFPGYYTISLAGQNIPLQAGQRFAAVVRYTTPSFGFPVPMELPVENFNSGATALAGQSFVSSDGSTWEDITVYFPNTNVAIKAFALVSCDDDDPCTDDSWDGTQCVSTPNTAPCNADSDGCTVDDTCEDGTCMPGDAPDCGAEDDACNEGVCQSTGDNTYACVKDPSPREGDPCNADSDGCTVNDACEDGTCMPGDAPDCSGEDDACNLGVCFSMGNNAYVCTKDSAPLEGESCDDLDSCTWDDACLNGECTGETPDCGDAHTCTQDSCNPDSGLCIHTPEDSACDDHNPCTVGSCSADTGCASDPLPDWTPCGEEMAACFEGECQTILPNDTCETPTLLTAGTPHEEGVSGWRPYRDASTACESDGLAGPDGFFAFDHDLDHTYTITATPSAGVDVSLVLWSDCTLQAACLWGANLGSEGEEERIDGFTSDTEGRVILQVIATPHDDKKIDETVTILVTAVPIQVEDGDEDGDEDSDEDGDTDSDMDGDQPDGDQPDGDEPDGDEPDGDEPDGDEPDGDEPDGDEPDGDQPDGDQPDGDQPDGDEPDGDEPDGDIPSDGDYPDGDLPNPDDPDGDEPDDGDPDEAGSGGGGGCTQTQTPAPLAALMLLFALVWRRRQVL